MAAFLAVHLLTPLAGLAVYLLLCVRMRIERIPRPPFAQFFLLFATYGGLLLVLLTGAFWRWSGMASLGAMYLVFCAPFVLFITAAGLRSLRPISRYHRAAFYTAAAYLPLWLAGVSFCVIHTLLTGGW